MILSAPSLQAQTVYDEQIAELQKQLEEVAENAGMSAEFIQRLAQIQADIDQLQKDVESDDSVQLAASETSETVSEAATSELASANIAAEAQSASAEPPEPGLEGTPNPLQREPQYLTGEDLLDESFPGSLPIPGTSSRFKIGGYVKLDAIHDFDYVGDRYEFELASIAVEGTPEYQLDGLSTLHAKESRVSLDVRKVARNEKYGWEFPLQMFLEVDFFDDRDAYRLQPRLRHAYGVIGKFLAGRTWSVTTDLSALAGTIDFSGGDALYGGRVSQIRYTDRINDSLKWAVGVEEASPSIGNPFELPGASRSSLPNFAGYLRWENPGRSHVQLGLDVYRMEWQGIASDSEWAYGASLSGHYLLGESKRNYLYGAVTVGSGAAHRVIALGFDGGNDAVITPLGLDAMSHWQVYGGYSHYWSDSLNSTISTAWTELDNSEFQSGSAIHRAGSAHINLIWFPYERVSTGVEYMWGIRENKDGAEGTANRLQFMTKFIFN